ncbi:unnamed protein product [Bursaphelenchus okinawaensis]|uniref:Kinesin-like protein n=1 Tax=Bursaphelenchus okinawaensis TaxID=465554 RepID=A0A811LN41_9BILA|nr:unnamed protein product [Bursaphelenchus okinawaensis]CAG9127188.1 unnamed protein product [Bursaphelenchus okinawaensis]
MEDQTIKVYARVKPGTDGNTVVKVASDQTITIGRERRSYSFDKAFKPQCSQAEIFDAVGKNIVNGVFDGFNGTIFAYGQTGSGKTYTMNGPDVENPVTKGLIPRCLEYLFGSLEQMEKQDRDSFTYEVMCSFVELYNETIFDLLDTTGTQPRIRVGINKAVTLEGACSYIASNVDQVIYTIRKGCDNRHVAETKMNRESSRSHSIFIISVQMKREVDGIINMKTAQLNLVDLAGSERQKHSQADGERLKEASHINKSLSTLARVIRTLSSQPTQHIPYRDSVLTHLLSDSLGGNSRTAFVLTMHQGDMYVDTTVSTALFGKTLKLITNNAHANEDIICEKWKMEMAQQMQLQKSKIQQLQLALDSRTEENVELKKTIEELKTNKEEADQNEYKEKLNVCQLKFEELAEEYQEFKKMHQAKMEELVSVDRYHSVRRKCIQLQAKVDELNGSLNDALTRVKDLEDQVEEFNQKENGILNMTEYMSEESRKKRFRRMTIFDVTERNHALQNRCKQLAETSMTFDDDTELMSDNEEEKPDNTRKGRPEVLYTCSAVPKAQHIKVEEFKQPNVVSMADLEKAVKKAKEEAEAEYKEALASSLGMYEEKVKLFEKTQASYINKIHKLKEEFTELRRERDDLYVQATEKLGHQNSKQKISYLNKLREQNVELTNENTDLKEKVYQLEQKLKP